MRNDEQSCQMMRHNDRKMMKTLQTTRENYEAMMKIKDIQTKSENKHD